MKAQLPDGRILEFPEGTSPEVIQRTVKQQLAIKPAQQEAGGFTQFGRGLGKGSADFLVGTGQTITDILASQIPDSEKLQNIRSQLANLQKASEAKFKRESADSFPAAAGEFIGEIAAPVAGTAAAIPAAVATLPAAAARSAAFVAERAPLLAASILGAGGAAGTGAIQPTAEELPPEEALQRRGEIAAEAGLIGGIAAPLIPAAAMGIRGIIRKSPVPNADELRKKAGTLYKVAEEKGGTLRPEFTNQFVDKIQSFKPQTDIGKAILGDSAFTKIIDDISTIRNKPITLEAAQEFDEGLSNIIDRFSEMGRLNKEGKKILDIQTEFRKSIQGISPDMIVGGKEGFAALKEARDVWAKSRKLADIERIIANAELSDQPATAIRSGFRTLLNSGERMKGFSKEERIAMRKAAKVGITGDILRVFGSRLVPIIASGSGGGLGAAATAQGAGMAARSIGAGLQVNKANRLAELIAGGKKAEEKIRLRPAQSSLAGTSIGTQHQ